jgi:hypothetical protein
MMMTYSATTILARRGASAIKSAILIRAISRMTAKWGKADLDQVAVTNRNFYEYTP